MNTRRLQPRLNPACEQLESRTMLSADIPGITVGRTLSSYTTGDVAGGQVEITYTVYNDQGHDVTGVLLTDTLKSDVTFQSATLQPDQSAQNLAWNLGTIPGFSRISVTLVVSVTNPVPLQLDAGARAFGILDAGTVTDDAPAATLRLGTVDASLLASTIDSNTTDPFIQAEAAQLDYDSQRIFDFLHHEIAYNSYVGSVRGARGTLWNGAGNSLDVASLGVALMRASGIPAQYAHGVLSDALAKELIVSMFPEQIRTVGIIPIGSITGDPANSTDLLDETTDHYWLQFDSGSGLQDADPLIAGASINQSFTTATTHFTEVPDALREKTTVTLRAETYGQAAGQLGLGDGLSETPVLTHTFNDVELVGHPLSIGNLVDSHTVGAVTFAVKTTTYAPYFAVGDVAFDTTSDQLIRGQTFQEVLTNFPLGNQILTALFLDVTQSGPGGDDKTYSRSLLDRIGYAARQGFVTTSVSVDPNGPPPISNYDVYTLNMLASTNSPSPLGLLSAQIDRQVNALPGDDATPEEVVTAESVVRDLDIAVTRLIGNQYLSQTDVHAGQAAAAAGVLAYYDRPRIVLTGSRVVTDVATESSRIAYQIDLVREEMRTLSPPGQPTSAESLFNTVRGIFNNITERNVIAGLGTGDATVQNTFDVFQAASVQGVGFTNITSDTLSNLDLLDITPEAKARITTDVLDGFLVVVPNKNVLINGVETIAWAEINQATGEFIGVTHDGGHEGLIEFFDLVGENLEVAEKLIEDLGGILAGFFVGAVLGLKYQLLNGITGDPGLAAEVLAEDKGDAIEFAEKLELGFKFTATLWATVKVLTGQDPPINPFLSHLNPPPVLPTNLTNGSITATANVATGAVAGTVQTPNLMVDGTLSAAWTASTVSAFDVTSLTASAASITDEGGGPIGSGAVSLNVADPVAAAILGNNQYTLNGDGSLTFFGPAETTLGASGNWDSYTATVSAASGMVSITLTTDSLKLNGSVLPAGRYTITVASATLSGHGASSSPMFSGTATLNATGADVIVGPGTGNVTVNAQSRSISAGITLSGYTGSLAVTGGAGNLDAVTFNGATSNFLGVTSSLPAITTDQNTPATFQINLLTSVSGNYDVTVKAPAGWTVALNTTGQVTVTPAPGLQAGTIPVVVVVQSAANPQLVAQCVVNVTINSTAPGITLAVNPDPIFTVPFAGAEVPSAFQTVIDNLGPAADTFALSFSNLSSNAFTILTSDDEITIPAGETGILGLYLQPDTTKTLPLPGANFSFTVTATSTSNPAITKSQVVNFTVPQIHSVTITTNPDDVNTIPGGGAAMVLTVKNTGNVPENLTFSSVLPTGLGLTNLQNGFPLTVGQTVPQTLNFTPASGTAVNTTLIGQVLINYGPAAARITQTVNIPVYVVVPGAAGMANASRTAAQLGNVELSDRLHQLVTAMGNLIEDPSNEIFRSQALALIDAIAAALLHDRFLAFLVPTLLQKRDQLASAVTSPQFQAAVTAVGNTQVNLSQFLNDEYQHGFLATLDPDTAIALPNAPATYQLFLQNTGSQATNYQLSVTGLPSGVTAVIKRNGSTITSVNMQPTEVISGGLNGITVELTQTGESLVPTTFNVQVLATGTSQIFLRLPATLAVRNSFLGVTQVIATPTFTPAGPDVDVSAKIFNTVNSFQQAKAFYVVRNLVGDTIFTSTPVPFDMTVGSSLVTVPLGSFASAGLADGSYKIDVTVTDLSGAPLAGGTGEGHVLIGLPITATLSDNPGSLEPGTGTITNSLVIDTQSSFTDPLTLIGQVQTVPKANSVVIRNNLAYVVGSNDIEVVDVSIPSNPQVMHTFGQADIVNGGFSIIRTANIVGVDYLLVGTDIVLNSHQFKVLVYSLTDPQAPALVSSTPFPYQVISEMLVSDNTLIVTTQGYVYGTFTGDISDQYGTVVSIDISNPASPQLKDVLFNNPARVPEQAGDTNQLGAVLVNDHLAYVASTTSVGDKVDTGIGRVLAVDFTDPANLTIVGQVDIPESVHAVSVAIQGNTALVVGSTGGWRTPQTATTGGLTGTITLTLLDISTPTSPVIIGSTLVTDAEIGVGIPEIGVESLGGHRFVLSQGVLNDIPQLLLIDATIPDHLVVSADAVPAVHTDITIVGGQLYATSVNGLSIYDIGPSDAIVFTASVQIPKGTGVAVVADSFDSPPSEIVSGVNFDTLIWRQALAFGESSRTLTWQSKITGLDAGEVLPVTLGGTVDFTSQGTPGTLNLPPTTVIGTQFVAISPDEQTLPPGSTATYTVTVFNDTDNFHVYNLVPLGLPIGWASLDPTIPVDAHSSNTTTLTITSDAFASLGDHSFAVRAQTPSGIRAVVYGTLVIAGPPPVLDPEAHGIVVTMTPATATLGQGTSTVYTVRLTNTGSTTDSYTLQALGLPGEIGAAFSLNQVEVLPGVSNFREVQLTLSCEDDLSPGSYPFTVQAYNNVLSIPISDTADATVNVVANGVDVAFNQVFVQPGGSLQLTVTNTGTQSDTFDLALAGPGALVSTLTANVVTLSPGDSQFVTINIGQVDFSGAGDLNLTATATSRANSIVRNATAASIQIPDTFGLDAEFSPDTKHLPTPGSALFLLRVDNLGNTDDAYTATITGTTGPISASLTGLDGTSTQTIALFRLPGLFRSVLSLKTSLTVAGSGTVTVQVRSLNNPEMTATATATVSADAPANEAPTDISLSSNTVAENRPVGTVVGNFSSTDPNVGDTFSYMLVAGDGADDNSAFALSPSGQLTTNEAFNFEAKDSYALRVRATDQGGLFFEKQFTVAVTNVDEPPEIVLTPGVRILPIPAKKVALDPQAAIRDVDSPVIQLANCTLQVTITENRGKADKIRLLKSKQGDLVIKSKHIFYKGTLIGERVYGKKGAVPLTVHFNESSTQPGVEAVLDRIYYRTKGEAAATRKLEYSLSGLAGGQTTHTTKDVQLG